MSKDLCMINAIKEIFIFNNLFIQYHHIHCKIAKIKRKNNILLSQIHILIMTHPFISLCCSGWSKLIPLWCFGTFVVPFVCILLQLYFLFFFMKTTLQNLYDPCLHPIAYFKLLLCPALQSALSFDNILVNRTRITSFAGIFRQSSFWLYMWLTFGTWY